MSSFLRFLLCGFAVIVLTSAQSARDDHRREWPSYNHDLAGTRFSPLTQINVDNVARLRQAWTGDNARST
jgi:quinoprotein glucose dehydrogenase